MAGYLQSEMQKHYRENCGTQRKRNLIHLREDIADMSLTSFAADIGIAKGNISAIESGERDLSVGNIQSYKTYFKEYHDLDISVDYLMGYTDIIENKSASIAKDLRLSDETLSFLSNMEEHTNELLNRLAKEKLLDYIFSLLWMYAFNCSHIEIKIKNYAIGSEEVIKDQSEAEALYREKTLDGFRTLIKLVGNLYEKDRNEAIERQIKILELENEKLKIEHQLMKAQKEESKKE